MTWLRKHYASGLFVASGRQVPRKGGVILARSGDRAALDELLRPAPDAAGAGTAPAALPVPSAPPGLYSKLLFDLDGDTDGSTVEYAYEITGTVKDTSGSVIAAGSWTTSPS